MDWFGEKKIYLLSLVRRLSICVSILQLREVRDEFRNTLFDGCAAALRWFGLCIHVGHRHVLRL